MNSKQLLHISIVLFVTLFVVSCSATRYVPQDKALLRKNELKLFAPKDSKVEVDKGVLESFIQQRPNKRLFGIGIALGFHNMTDSSKHTGWHRFWADKIGSSPVIFDSAQMLKSALEMDVFLSENGYFNADVLDSVSVSARRKATVVYTVQANKPYIISKLSYNIRDKFLEQVFYQDTVNSLVKSGAQYQTALLDSERNRISTRLKNEGFWGFGISYISYTADSTHGNNTVSLTLNIRQMTERVDASGREVLVNHPIYRIGKISINSFYDPTLDFNHITASQDSIEYNGVSVLFNKRPYIRPEILVNSVRLSPNEIFDQQAVTRTRDNLRTLGYSANIIFSPMAVDSSNNVVVTLTDQKSGENVTTAERQLNCYIQCVPNVRQDINAEMELSTTSDYYSAALSLGYQNINMFRGAETFGLNFRGAYELMKSNGHRNSFEIGATVSLSAPRFWLPISKDKESLFKGASSKVSVSYSIQNRPDYRRTIVSGVFGYSWTLKNGARFTINPADINLVSVPWVDEDFLQNISNPYLRNSYTSQLIAGLSASYFYTTNPKLDLDGFTFRGMLDVNGNLFRALSSWFSAPHTQNGETYYNLFGLRFAQYARASFDVSGRANLSETTQFAWRFLLAGGYAYGNSRTIPFERLFFAGGANSMRGWQVRTLGPGSVAIDSMGSYPNQLGDLRVEANVELRQKVVYDLSMAVFFDAGNIWMNSQGESREQARFKFGEFYKQIALNTGIGLRYDIAGMMTVRFDWGLKLHNPNMVAGKRWFTNLGIGDTAFHFAIGLPF